VNFSVSSVTVDWTAAAASLALLAGYVVAAVVAGRRFGVRGLWAVWIAGIVAGGLFPFLLHGESVAHFDPASMLYHAVMLAVALGISAWVIARTLRRPRPAGIPVQIALGALAFILALLVMIVVSFIVIATH
jgi:hypothetical protein